MLHLGKVQPGSTLYIPFETFAAATGAPITISSFSTSDIQIYKDGGTTQRASASGITLLDTDGIDFDGITGIHGFSINLADNTTADFYASGSRYIVVVSTVTVDSVTMSFIAATFSIGEEGSILDTTIATLASQTSFTLTTGPAEDDALNGCVAIIHDAASAVQQTTAMVLDYTGSTKTVTLAAAGTFTVAAKDNISFQPARVVLADAMPHGGTLGSSTATLAMKQVAIFGSQTDPSLWIRNSAASSRTIKFDNTGAGSTVWAVETLADGIAFDFYGGIGCLSLGCETGNAIYAHSYTSGDAVDIGSDVSGHALSLTGTGSGKRAILLADEHGGVLDGAVGPFVRSGTAQSGNSSSIRLDSGASSTNDLYKGQQIVLTGGTGSGQCRTIVNYNGNTKQATVDRNWTTAPDGTTTFAQLATDSPTLNSNLQVTANVATASIRSGTAQAGSTSTTIKLDSGASATNNLYNGSLVTLTGGTGLGQTRTIISYVGSTKVATVDKAWVTTPDATTTFSIYASTTASTFSDQGVAQAGGASSITLAATASATNSVYNGSIVTILSGTGSGQTREITAYNGTTKVATVDSAWSVTPDSTSSYAVIPTASGQGNSGEMPSLADIISGVLNTVMTESYAADGSPMTLAQALYEAVGNLEERNVSGTTVTIKKRDGSTTAMTLTLNSATQPTGITRAT